MEYRTPVAPSLTDAYLKTTRARTHLDALRNELELFRTSEPFRLVPEDDIKADLYRLRVKVVPPNPNLAMIFGDLMYCLRASLDYTVWALAHIKIPSPDHTQFPIFDHLTPRNRQKFAQYTAGVPADAVKVMESLQPYNRVKPSQHLLSRLNHLCNLDKHRRIAIHSEVVEFNVPRMPKALARIIKFDDQEPMASVPLSLKSQMAVNPNISVEVAFGDFSPDSSIDITCTVDGATRIYEFVADSVIPRFARFF